MEEQTEKMYELMRKESNRLKTFQMNPPWPKDYVDIKKLAKAGFFYAFNEDNVHCAFCRGQVCRWDRDDDPMSEHARHFTTCPFIMGGDVGNEPLGEDPFPGPKRPRPYDVCGAYRHEMTNHINFPQEQQLPSSIPLSYHQVIEPSYISGYSSSSPSNINGYSSGSSSSSPSNLNGICKICYENTIQLVFLPCGHSVSCLSCSQRLFTCPCCRATITTRIRTFLV